MARVLLVFVDGVGLGDDDVATNPFAAAKLPVLLELLDGARPLRSQAPRYARAASLIGIDAQLGVAGLPQSGTGQAALLTGINAAQQFGRHFGPWVPTALRSIVEQRSILARAVNAGRSVAFANAYPEEVIAGGTVTPPPELARRRAGPYAPLRAGPPMAARAAGLLTRSTAHLLRGEAIASELTNEGWRVHLGRRELPVITPAAAGRNLARIVAAHELTLFAHYATDAIGHRGNLEAGMQALENFDAFLGGILAELPPDMLLLIASDHGNLEDVRCGHTRNPALAVVAGQNHARLARELRTLTDVAPLILRVLDIGTDPARQE